MKIAVRLKALFLFGLFIVGQTGILYAQDTTSSLSDRFTLNGYVKDLRLFSFAEKFDEVISNNIIHNRINLRYYHSDRLTVAMEFRNRLFYGEQVKLTPGFGKLVDIDNGLVDLSFLYFDEDAAVLHTIIDRAWMNYGVAGKYDVRLGRQRINWGVNLVWNPNDLFNVLNFIDFDYEERPGSDAIRIQYYPGLTTSVELSVRPGKDEDDWVGAGLYKFNTSGYDIQFLGGVFKTDLVVGTGWAGNIKNAGFKGEASYFHPRSSFFDTSGVLSASISLDYMFPSTLYLHGSVLYNSGGSSEGFPTSFDNAFFQPLSPKNLMPSKYSCFGQVSYGFTPIFNGSFAAIYSPGINASFAMPSISYSLRENWDIGLFYQAFWLEQAEEVRNIGNTIFIRLKYSY